MSGGWDPGSKTMSKRGFTCWVQQAPGERRVCTSSCTNFKDRGVCHAKSTKPYCIFTTSFGLQDSRIVVVWKSPVVKHRKLGRQSDAPRGFNLKHLNSLFGQSVLALCLCLSIIEFSLTVDCIARLDSLWNVPTSTGLHETAIRVPGRLRLWQGHLPPRSHRRPCLQHHHTHKN